jgi:predicted DNA-binding protein (MmcQ/YjbR family)
MTIEDIQTICKRYKGVTEDIKWEDHLCFNVGGKMFLVTAPDQVPCSASIKVSDETFEEISSQDGFMPAPYMARYKWVHMDDINRLSKKQWESYIRTAYEMVAAKLSKKIKKDFGLD